MDIIDIMGLIVLGVPLLLGVIGVIITRIRSGKSWIGQGYGGK